MIDAPSGGAPKQAPRWDLTGTEGCGGGIRVSWCSLMVSGYVGIYRRKRHVRGATRGPRGWGRAPSLVAASFAFWRVLQVFCLDIVPKMTLLKVSFRWT